MYHFEEFEVLTTVVMKISIFWDITLCSPLNRLRGPHVQRNTRLYVPEDRTLYRLRFVSIGSFATTMQEVVSACMLTRSFVLSNKCGKMSGDQSDHG
jgi:hypothetical protein